MRPIAIIGAGQAGLCLGLVLKRLGYPVSLFSNRTAEQIRKGRVLSTQAMFDKALQFEKKWGFNKWDKECRWGESVTLSLGVPGQPKKAIHWKAKLQRPFQSIDQRLKFSDLLKEYEETGGKLHIQDVGVNELNDIAKEHDLTIVAGGKGEISQCFPRDPKKSSFDKPQRALACMYVNGIVPDEPLPGVRANIIPGVGECFIIPSFSFSGPCETIFFEGIPGGPFDCFKSITDPEEQLRQGVNLLKQYIPWEGERCENVQLIDNQATLVGRFPPTIREPIAKMPCGKPVLGMADTIVLNDPIAGQGSNTAAHCTEVYLQSILERGDKPFNEEWMRETSQKFWNKSAEGATAFSNMLLMPPPPHVLEFLGVGIKNSLAAEKFAHAFEDPNSLFPWILSPETTKELIGDLQKEANL